MVIFSEKGQFKITILLKLTNRAIYVMKYRRGIDELM